MILKKNYLIDVNLDRTGSVARIPIVSFRLHCAGVRRNTKSNSQCESNCLSSVDFNARGILCGSPSASGLHYELAK